MLILCGLLDIGLAVALKILLSLVSIIATQLIFGAFDDSKTAAHGLSRISMTVSYSLDVSTSGILTFIRVLFRWRGSVYKALWRELLGFICIYYAINFTYRFGLGQAEKEVFHQIAAYCEHSSSYIPLSFILGFYVTMVFNRWWSQFKAVAWPDTVALLLACYVPGKDERSRVYRRTVARFVNLSCILGLRMISSAVKKRFPTMEHIVEAGVMTEDEHKQFEAIPTRYAKQWVPCQWAMTLLVRARAENKIQSDYNLGQCIHAINNFRINVRDMCFFDWVSIPVVYTQVVTLAVYSFFMACLLGRQHYEKHEEYIYVPVFTLLQFIFYVGWLKVAECMINPFGEDDDDFEVNFMVDRNLELSYVIADDNHDCVPPLEHDLFWDTHDIYIPHTAASYGVKSKNFDGSAAAIVIRPDLTDLVIEDFALDSESEAQAGRASPGPPGHEESHHGKGFLRRLSLAVGLSSSQLHHPANGNLHRLQSPASKLRKMMVKSASEDTDNASTSRHSSTRSGKRETAGDRIRKVSTASATGSTGRWFGGAQRSLRTRPLMLRQLGRQATSGSSGGRRGSCDLRKSSVISVCESVVNEETKQGKVAVAAALGGRSRKISEECAKQDEARQQQLDTISETSLGYSNQAYDVEQQQENPAARHGGVKERNPIITIQEADNEVNC